MWPRRIYFMGMGLLVAAMIFAPVLPEGGAWVMLGVATLAIFGPHLWVMLKTRSIYMPEEAIVSIEHEEYEDKNWYMNCTENLGHYPVGFCALVWASNPQEATDLLNAELEKRKLDPDATVEHMKLLLRPSLDMNPVFIPVDGDY